MTGFVKKIEVPVFMSATEDYCGRASDGKRTACGCVFRSGDGLWWCSQYGREVKFVTEGRYAGSWKRLPLCIDEHGLHGEGSVPSPQEPAHVDPTPTLTAAQIEQMKERECRDTLWRDYTRFAGRLCTYDGSLCGYSETGDSDSVEGRWLLRVANVNRDIFDRDCIRVDDSGWVDAFWDVEVLLAFGPGRALRSCWIDGTSRNYKTREVCLCQHLCVVNMEVLWTRLTQGGRTT
jgi:hypothetical protein